MTGLVRPLRLRFHAVPRCFAAVLLPLAAAGCAVGPDFVPPTTPRDAGFLSTPAVFPSAGSADAAQRPQWGAQVADRWWSAFHSTDLDDTVALALAGSPTLDTARATLAAAQQAILVARGGLYPQFDAAASAERSRASLGGA